MSRHRRLALGLLLGAALDAIVPDPRRGHPVAAFGTAAGALEKRCWADSRVRGAAFTAVCVGVPLVAGRIVDKRRGPARVAVVAAATWAVLGARSLRAEAGAVDALLARDDLAGARERVTHLVGRDPQTLDADGVARAVVESVAENTCDAVVAPLFWGALAGVPGLLGYRAVNTLDAMVGHRCARYANFGWASARLDDVANLVPARLTAALTVLASSFGGAGVGVDARAALRVALRDGRNHPSPNSGLSEAAFAGALGVRLGGRVGYQGRVEHRPTMGDGRAPTAADIRRATRLSAAVSAAAAVLAAASATKCPAKVSPFRENVPERRRSSEDR